MLNRRAFIIRLAGTAAATSSVLGCSHLSADAPLPVSHRSKPYLYASEGNALSWFAVDVDQAELRKMGTIKAAEIIQFAAMHPNRRFLYAALSNGGTGGSGGDTHLISAFRVDRDNGAVQLHGELIPLPARPIHIVVDPGGEYLLLTFNKPAAVRVYRIDPQGRVGLEVPQPEALDVGIFPHQASLAASGKTVYVCGRGNDAAPGKAADAGTLTSFRFSDGALRPLAQLKFAEGIGPRDMEIHPSKPWVFIALERGNKLAVHALDGATVVERPLFVRDTPALPQDLRARQRTGAVHLHPNGTVVYITNRANKTQLQDGKAVFAGGENSIAVFSIDQRTGEPTLIQHVDTQGIEPRTFVIDPGGRMLVVGNQSAMLMAKDRGGLSLMPAGLAIFRIAEDGKLDYVRSRVADSSEELIWTGIVRLG